MKYDATHTAHDEIEMQTWIDHIYLDNNDKILSHNNIPPNIRNVHNIIDVEISLFVPKPPQHTFSYRQFKNITSEDINRFLMNCDWTPLHNSESSTENLLDCLNSILQSAIDELAPLKTINSKKKKLPWVDHQLQHVINKHKATEKKIYQNQK